MSLARDDDSILTAGARGGVWRGAIGWETEDSMYTPWRLEREGFD